MQHAGLQIVEELARRFGAGDMEGAFALYHPALRIVQPASLPHGGVHEGRDGVKAMGATFAQFWTRTISAPQRHAAGEGVVQVTSQTWTAKASGRAETVEVVELFAFAEGMVKEIRVFQHDTHRLLATLGPVPWERAADLALVDAATASRLGKHWVEGWNGEDPATIVAPFAEDVLFSSPYLPRFAADGAATSLRGLSVVRQYVTDALARATRGIRYTLDASYVGTDTVVLCYTVQHPTLGLRQGVDTMRLDPSGRVSAWHCHYPFAEG